jgi:hypothetical protein
MPVAVKMWDVTRPGQRADAGELLVEALRTTARELIAARVVSEVSRVNSLPPLKTALIEVSAAERLLNGDRQKGIVDAAVQVEKAMRAFQSNGFLLFVDGTQLMELDQAVELELKSEMEFFKLAPLVGG